MSYKTISLYLQSITAYVIVETMNETSINVYREIYSS